MKFERSLALPFFQGLKSGRLLLPRCRQCGKFHWYPMPRCPYCRSTDLAAEKVHPEGVIFTISTVHHPFEKTAGPAVPFTVALVEFSDAPGVRLVSLVAGDASAVDIGDRVAATFGMSEDPSGAAYLHVRKIEEALREERK